MYLVGLKKQRYTQASETNFCHISIPHKILGFEFPKIFWPSYIKIVTTAKSTSCSSSTRSGFGYLESGFQLPASCTVIYTKAKWVYNTT